MLMLMMGAELVVAFGTVLLLVSALALVLVPVPVLVPHQH